MITRLTYWLDERGQVVQVGAAVLAPDWEEQAHLFRECGPFDNVAEVLADILMDVQAWYRAHGQQMTLYELL